ncbi:hypothetical protein F8154_00755 [Alkaliphilus pronyensis]|uniref:Phospholipase A2 domain-containing protein n=1 Tax=Alkaliphilus pronyensis TaxID=1482732 RepID=A0A6I0FU13_9FIRM|nr:hypothetical protein [Alkaliphilus pronyensis]KAB3539714.1 hypothetical protein F8154_00755 [Alkaliphilus pronyensis]
MKKACLEKKKQLIKKSNEDREYKQLLHSLIKEKSLKLNDTSLEAFAHSKGDFFTEILKMDISEEIKVYFIMSPRGTHSFASEVTTLKDKVFVKGFKMVSNEMTLDYEFEFDSAEYDEIISDLNKKQEYISEEEQEEKNIEATGLLPCIYGNWCGPMCSGPDAPISAVDRCCMHHDQCYGEQGYFNCDCDREIIICLLPYYYMGSEWAILITEYFLLQYNINCS